jgi:hypothetical protein
VPIESRKVVVFAFDGSSQIHPVVPFSSDNEKVSDKLSGALDGLARPDPSTNLYGAVIEPVKTLRRAMKEKPQPLKFGTLVVRAAPEETCSMHWGKSHSMSSSPSELAEKSTKESWLASTRCRGQMFRGLSQNRSHST